jgi:hypothetical protein
MILHFDLMIYFKSSELELAEVIESLSLWLFSTLSPEYKSIISITSLQNVSSSFKNPSNSEHLTPL